MSRPAPVEATRPSKTIDMVIFHDTSIGYWIAAEGKDWDMAGPYRKTEDGAVKAWNALVKSFQSGGACDQKD